MSRKETDKKTKLIQEKCNTVRTKSEIEVKKINSMNGEIQH